jgi:ankyrin repeat protein
VCQLDTLGKCRNRAMLRKALAALPPTLDKTYERILCAIVEEDAEYAVRALLWLAFSDRPLAVDEVAEAIAIDVARDPAFDREEVLEDPLEALEICSSLVTISSDSGNGRVQSTGKVAVLAHYSVKEYLISDRIQQGQAARYSMQAAACHNTIARACLGYLGQLQEPGPMTVETLGKHKLAEYSAEFWMSHAQKAGDQVTETSKAALLLLSRENAAYINWIRIHDPDRPWWQTNLGRKLEETPNPLYYAALFGLEDVSRLLLDKGADVNTQGGYYGNALQAASSQCHEAVVRLLLDKGADVNMQGGYYNDALQAASFQGHEAMVRLLLGKGADVNMQGGLYDNALRAASFRGHETVVKLLLDKGADANMQGGLFDNALRAASSEGHKSIVKLLLDKGADVNAQGGLYDNALRAASSGGHEAVVRLLFDKGADVNTQAGHYGNALQAALSQGHVAVVRLLLDKGADVKVLDRIGRTPLLQAAEDGNVKMVSMLMDERPDLAPKSKDSQPLLWQVVANELVTVVETIRTMDKDRLNSNTLEHGYTPLLWAAAKGHERVVELLLQRGVDPDSKDQFGQSPLSLAAASGHEAVVRLLLATDGVNPNSMDTHYEYCQTPLAWAAKKGHAAVVSMLLAKKDIDINCVDRRGRTPQVLAERGGQDAVLRVLRSCS